MTTHPTQDPSVQARALAAWFQMESAARRFQPITEVYADLGDVRLTVCPTGLDVWEWWCSLLQISEDSVKWGRGMVHAVGTWSGIPVRVRGLDIERWAER